MRVARSLLLLSASCVVSCASCGPPLPDDGGTTDLAGRDLTSVPTPDLTGDLRGLDFTTPLEPDLAGRDFAGAEQFPEVLYDGVWLIGWSQAVDHFSWVRFERNGKAFVLDPQHDPMIVRSYWLCNGEGKWERGGKPEAIELFLPREARCRVASESLTFGKLGAALLYPKAHGESGVIGEQGRQLQGFKFPDAHCDPEVKICKDPR